MDKDIVKLIEDTKRSVQYHEKEITYHTEKIRLLNKQLWILENKESEAE